MEITEKTITFHYLNHQGKYGIRTVTPTGYRYGTSEYHKKPTHLIVGFDHDRQAEREYDLSLMSSVGPSLRSTTEFWVKEEGI